MPIRIRTVALMTGVALFWTSISVGEPPVGSDPFGGAGVSMPPGVKRLEPGESPPVDTIASEVTKRFEAELNSKTSVCVEKMPLINLMTAIADAHSLPIVVDQQSLRANKVDPDVLVTIGLSNVSLRSALTLILRKIELDYVIKDEVLQIKSREDVIREPVLLGYKLDSIDTSREDLAALIQSSLDATHSDPMPRPVVKLVRNTQSSRGDLYVQANRSMHSQVQKILKQVQDNKEPQRPE